MNPGHGGKWWAWRDACRGGGRMRAPQVVALLNTLLADGIDLMVHAKQAQWTAQRRLHPILAAVEEKVEACVDRIGERSAELAGTALGTLWISGRRATLREAAPGPDHIAALSGAIRAYARSARGGVDEAHLLGDIATARLLLEVDHELDRLLRWIDGHGAAPTWL